MAIVEPASQDHADTTRLRPVDRPSVSDQVRTRLLDAIVGGGMDDGLLPSTAELARRLRVSTASVRQALQSLEDERVVIRQRGVGLVVNPHVAGVKVPLGRVAGFPELISAAGREARLASAEVSLGTASPELAKRLDCAPGDAVTQAKRLFEADSMAAVVTTETLLTSNIATEPDPDSLPDAPAKMIGAFTGHSLDYSILELASAAPADGPRTVLAVGPDDPLLRLVEIYYTTSNHAVMTSEAYVVDRFVRFKLPRRP